ncbi:unnamed protein product [Cuscuta epithymum]|uniref:Uncharacterized protein n=1 Tax=Cuscuta epithymum TaxID=186058 RepID=A0AAV0DHH7_9ASTE|nr:unnamed protein product [Cuscuta epithymum]
MTTPAMTATTSPPATMLSKKFFRDGEILSAASATPGVTKDAVSAAAVSPVTALSLSDALTSKFPAGFDAAIGLDCLAGDIGFKKEPKAAAVGCRLRAATVSGGITMETAQVEAIYLRFDHLAISALFRLFGGCLEKFSDMILIGERGD